jgi:hypothetical protein
MPPEIDQVLFEREAIGPLATRPDGLAVIGTGHDGIVVLDHVVHRQHPESEFGSLELLGNFEIGRDEWGD